MQPFKKLSQVATASTLALATISTSCVHTEHTPESSDSGPTNAEPRAQVAPQLQPMASAAASARAGAAARPTITHTSEEACPKICDKSHQLHCAHADECMTHCLAMGSLTPCKDDVATLYQCLVEQPIAHWECGEDGVAAIREGYCDKPQERAVLCMEAKMQAP